MRVRKKAVELLKKYKHIWVFSYFLIYLPWFYYLEEHVTSNYHVIHTTVDTKIPFIAAFIIPYFSWFVFVGIAVTYFFFADVEEFYKMSMVMMTGMTVFLIVSTVYPNGLMLRPFVVEGNTVCDQMVRFLYSIDTPTNVFPSLHVFNTLAVCIAVRDSKRLSRHKVLCGACYVQAALIILSTMFLKQHSVIDVAGAFVMAEILYQRVYVKDTKTVLVKRKLKHAY